MDRRSYLALLGTGLTLGAGCQGQIDVPVADEPTQTSTDASREVAMGQKASVGDLTVRVSNPHLEESVFLDHGIFISLKQDDGTQFVVADVTIDGDADPNELGYSLVVDGETYRPDFSPPIVMGGAIGLPAPVEPAAEAKIVLSYQVDEVAWRLGDEFVNALDTVPSFAVLEARIESAESEIVLVLTVENVGDRDGTFRALVAPEGIADAERPVKFDVPVGEKITHEEPLGEFENPDSLEITTEWSAETRQFEYGRGE